MPPNESRYPDDWFRLAERDRQRVARCLADSDASLAGFCLQQAVEKALKGFLLQQGQPLRRIHDLEALLDDAVVFDQALEQFRPACQRITNFYMIERYLLVGVGAITLDDVRASVAAVEPIFEHLRPPSSP